MFKCRICGKSMSDNFDGVCFECFYSGEYKTRREEFVEEVKKVLK